MGGGVSSNDITVIVNFSDQSPLSAKGKSCVFKCLLVSCVYWSGNGVDYDSTPINATFAAGTANTMINIPVIKDDIAEGLEMFNLYIIIPMSLTDEVFLGKTATGFATITDNTSKFVLLCVS